MIQVNSVNNRPLPTDSTNQGRLLRGFKGRRSYWTFAFESPSSLWALEDITKYTPGTSANKNALMAFTGVREGPNEWWSRPVFTRSGINTALVQWTFDTKNATWYEKTAGKQYFNDCVFSITGRYEGGPTAVSASGTWTMYAASRSKLFRVLTPTTPGGATTIKTIAYAQRGTVFRGISLPPWGAAGATALPSPTTSRSASAPPTRTPSRSRTASRSRKPRFA